MSTARFRVEFINKEAQKEYQHLDGSVRAMCTKGLARLALRADEIGKPLSGSLQGCRELKFRANGLRIIYRIEGSKVEIVRVAKILAIGARENDKVFKVAANRTEAKD